MRIFRLTAAAAFLTALIAGPSWGYTPGTYEASAQGMKGPVKVAVTFSKDAVTSVKVIEEKETAGIGTTAAAELPRQIVEAQSTKIDGLSGATVTRKPSSRLLKTAFVKPKAIRISQPEALRRNMPEKRLKQLKTSSSSDRVFQDLPLPSTLLSTVPE